MLNKLADDYYIPIHEAAVLLDCTPRHIQGRISQGWFRYLKGKHGSRLVPKFVYMPDVQEVKKNGYVRQVEQYVSIPEAVLLTGISVRALYYKRAKGFIRWVGKPHQVYLSDVVKEAQNIISKKNKIACK